MKERKAGTSPIHIFVLAQDRVAECGDRCRERPRLSGGRSDDRRASSGLSPRDQDVAGRLHQAQKLVASEWFRQKGQRRKLPRDLGGLPRQRARNENRRVRELRGAGPADQIHAAETGHAIVRDEDVHRTATQNQPTLLAIARPVHAVSVPLQARGYALQHHRIVVDDEHADVAPPDRSIAGFLLQGRAHHSGGVGRELVAPSSGGTAIVRVRVHNAVSISNEVEGPRV